MTKPFLLFAIKCSVIVYFAACTSIEHYSKAISASPTMTTGTWKVKLYQDTHNNNTNEFSGYTFTFDRSGNVNASKNGVNVRGNWVEDDISKKITIDIKANDPVLSKLNTNWNITNISSSEVSLQNNSMDIIKLDISSL